MTKIQAVVVREGVREDWKPAIELAWRSFNLCVAADYTAEGREVFRRFLSDESLYRMFAMGSYRLFVATLYGRYVGMLTLRQRAHISLLFVEEGCQGNGIGSALVEMAAETVAAENRGNTLSVHASPGAAAFYRRIGFTATEPEQEREGVRFTPMVLKLE